MQRRQISNKMFEKGFRVVDGKITHLRVLYPSKAAKVKALLKAIPCATTEEQVEVMNTCCYGDILCRIETSLHMSHLAIAEYKKLTRRSLWSGLFFERKDSDLERAYREKEEMLSGMRNRWLESFRLAKAKNPTIDLELWQLEQTLDMCDYKPKISMDVFLSGQ